MSVPDLIGIEVEIISKEKVILNALRERYPMVLVSNFYGNVQAVLKDFGY